MSTNTNEIGAPVALSGILRDYSVEVTSRDRKSLDAAGNLLPAGTEVFIAALPGDSDSLLVAAAAQLKKAGLTPVPHIVARNTESLSALEDLMARLVGEAGVDRVLSLGGDRDKPAGNFLSSLELIQTGVYRKNGIGKIFIGSYPEGHPKIPDAVLDQARTDKLAAAAEQDLHVTIVSQFCFDAKPIIAMVQRMRAAGVTAPFRAGVAGPADRALLIKYAIICGVGNSLRVLKDRGELTKGLLAGETPEALIRELAIAQSADRALGIDGIHFFTFGSVARSAQWAEAHRH
jgi:methylenetetrahydrofolate reductase (NADPH)